MKRFEMLDSDQDGRIKVDDYIDDIRFFFTDVGPKDDQDRSPFYGCIYREDLNL